MFITVSKKSKSDLLARLLFTDLENFSRFLPRSYHSASNMSRRYCYFCSLYNRCWLQMAQCQLFYWRIQAFYYQSRREKPLSWKVEADTASQAKSAMEAFSCPKEDCVRVFQRFSSLERHLSTERCSKSLVLVLNLAVRSCENTICVTFRGGCREDVHPEISRAAGMRRNCFYRRRGMGFKRNKEVAPLQWDAKGIPGGQV